ncbi:MAG: hypothetical protein HKN29_01905 [Rhodothermales bacterium]|nr:hypothetical protein [Rhodothermales bacterium]
MKKPLEVRACARGFESAIIEWPDNGYGTDQRVALPTVHHTPGHHRILSVRLVPFDDRAHGSDRLRNGRRHRQQNSAQNQNGRFEFHWRHVK